MTAEIPRSAWIDLVCAFDCHPPDARQAIAHELERLGDDFAAGLAAAITRPGGRSPNPVSRALARA